MLPKLHSFTLLFLTAITLQGLTQSPKVFLPKDFSDRITRFHADISVEANGNIQVSENITIYNGHGESTPGFDKGSFSFNDDIKRGIVRDFPTKYQDSAGFWHETGFTIRAIYKNGEAEHYATDKLTNGVRIRVGKEDVLLDTGFFYYRIDYVTNRQLIFHDNKHELYWNVNGNGWVFTADTVSCSITFPKGAAIIERACYTGPQGSTSSNCRSELKGEGAIYFQTTEKLNSYDGMTVAVSIEKGLLQEPTRLNIIIAFLNANYIIPLLSFLFCFITVYYFMVWYKRGRDPRKGVIYPQFAPPEGLTPPDVGYIVEQKYDSHLFTAALVDCAVNKQLEIQVAREGLILKSNVYNFLRPSSAIDIRSTKNEYGFDLQTLFGEKVQRGKFNTTIRSCYIALENVLKERFLVRRGKQNKWQSLFALNRGYVTFGWILFVLSVFLSFQFLVTHPSFKLLVICAIFLCAMLIVQIVFANIMSSYTRKGREIADHLLGFKMYLEQAEKHIYNQLAPPERTLELFEKYLPYAIALQVENNWAAKFEDIMQEALANGYRPAYYSTHGAAFNALSLGDMSRNISSGLSNTISSASTPPSSSSGGSSGGGSSGGGGGGGGGGGW